MNKCKFEVSTKGRVRYTTDNSQIGTLFSWIEEIAGTEEAINAQCWSELCEEGEYYNGENFEIICLGDNTPTNERWAKW